MHHFSHPLRLEFILHVQYCFNLSLNIPTPCSFVNTSLVNCIYKTQIARPLSWFYTLKTFNFFHSTRPPPALISLNEFVHAVLNHVGRSIENIIGGVFTQQKKEKICNSIHRLVSMFRNHAHISYLSEYREKSYQITKNWIKKEKTFACMFIDRLWESLN